MLTAGKDGIKHRLRLARKEDEQVPYEPVDAFANSLCDQVDSVCKRSRLS